MKRRDLLKSLTMVAGGSLCSGSGWSQATTPSDEKRQGKLAVPVRALIRRNGASFQPVELDLLTRYFGEEEVVPKRLLVIANSRFAFSGAPLFL